MSPAVYDRHHSVAAFIREINDNIIPVNDLEHHHVSTLDELLGGDRGWNYSKSPPPKKKTRKNRHHGSFNSYYRNRYDYNRIDDRVTVN